MSQALVRSRRRGTTIAARPPGAMLLFATVLFAAVAALTIAVGTYVAAQSWALARARADAVRARLAAESAVRTTLASWPREATRALPLLAERPLPDQPPLAGGARGRILVRRLGGDLYLLLGQGRAGVARARVGALVRVLSLASFLPQFPAAVAAGGGRLWQGARVAVLPPTAPPPPWLYDACDPGAADTLVAILGDSRRPGLTAPAGAVTFAGATVEGEPPFAEGTLGPPPEGLGPIPWQLLPTLADRIEAGTVTPGVAVRDGSCDLAAPGNWGAPLDPNSPCADYFPVIFAPGDLRLLGGSGQGVLVVRGALDMEGDARFFGPVLVGGTARLSTSARIQGALRAATIDAAGEVDYSACVLLRTLAGAPGLVRPLRAGRRLWIPVF